MALPLPKVVPDAPQGGYVMGGMNAINALTKENIENQYLPMKTQAETASKLAYANLMGPQFLAKLMANDPILANMSEDQKTNAISSLYRASTGQGTGNAILSGNATSGDNGSPMPNGNGNAMTGNGFLGNGALRAFVNYLNPQQQQASQPQSQPVQPNQQPAQPSQQPAPTVMDHNQTVRDDRLAAWMGLGHSRDQPIPAGFRPDLVSSSTPVVVASSSPTFAEKTGAYKGVVAEGEESGKIRSKDIEDLNNQVFNSETALTTLGDVGKVISSPEFEQIRQVPLAGRHELAYYAKEGTPEQQQMVGRYYTLTGNLVKDASRDFAGSFRKGEQLLLEGMKPNAGDTVDTAKGKTESLTYLLTMLKERSKMTSDLMAKYHINKGQANDIADQALNGTEIRGRIHDSLNPTVTVRNKKTGKVETVSGAEARKRGAVHV